MHNFHFWYFGFFFCLRFTLKTNVLQELNIRRFCHKITWADVTKALFYEKIDGICWSFVWGRQIDTEYHFFSYWESCLEIFASPPMGLNTRIAGGGGWGEILTLLDFVCNSKTVDIEANFRSVSGINLTSLPRDLSCPRPQRSHSALPANHNRHCRWWPLITFCSIQGGNLRCTDFKVE